MVQAGPEHQRASGEGDFPGVALGSHEAAGGGGMKASMIERVELPSWNADVIGPTVREWVAAGLPTDELGEVALLALCIFRLAEQGRL